MTSEKKRYFAVHKNVIDELFDKINKGEAWEKITAWRKMEELVSNDLDAADALRDSITPGRLQIIDRALHCDNAEIIEPALAVKVALRKSHERNQGYSLEQFAKNNEAHAQSDRIVRSAADKPAGSKRVQKKTSAKVIDIKKTSPK